MNDINITNLDLGYEQCKTINSISSTAGDNLLSNLSSNIANLKSHWIGTDATAHINNLINVYKGLGSLINDAMKVTYNAAESMIYVQGLRHANGGGGMIGESLSSSKEFATITPAESTVEYYVDAGALSDLTTLQDIFSQYQEFLTEFANAKDELIANWLAGANREEVISMFELFNDNTASYTEFFKQAIENLSAATKNISQQ